MLSKINVLAHALRLGSFRVKTLAESAAVPPSTVSTVLSRCPKQWTIVCPLLSGSRGGQQHQYQLTRFGRGEIEAELGRLPALAPLAPLAAAQANLGAPRGLRSAQATLNKLRVGNVPEAIGEVSELKTEITERVQAGKPLESVGLS